LMARLGRVRCHISISHERSHAAALAIIEEES
jgi:phosphopantetheinyl transferase (holo-ACP synthase)